MGEDEDRIAGSCPQGGGSVVDMEEDLPLALVTVEPSGAEVIPVVEVDGVLVDRRDGSPVDLVSLVVVVGLPELEPAA